MAIAALWLAGRVLVLTPFGWAAAVVNVAFLLAVAIGIGVPLVRSGNRRIALAVSLRLSPLSSPWLLAKIIGWFVYVALGMVALRFGRTPRTRAVAWSGALFVFAYIVTVAISKNPRGMFA